MRANAVLVNGVSYASGEVVYAAKTDDSGLFQTAADLLPYGTYEVREVSPPTGYTGDGTTSRTFSIEQNGVIVDLTDFEHAISNEVIRGGVKLYKYDIESQEYVGQGEATVAGAKFEIVNRTGDKIHIQLALSARNAPEDFWNLCDRVRVLSFVRPRKDGWKWWTVFRTESVSIGESVKKEEIFEKLDQCMEQVRTFEGELKQSLTEV